MFVTDRYRYMHLRGLHKCTVTLFITAHNENKMENDERKPTQYLHFPCCRCRCRPSSEACCLHAKRFLIGWFVYPRGWFVKGKKCALKKTTGPSCFPSIFATKKKRKKKSDVPSKRYRMFVRKSVFCTWDIPIVLYVRYQNALFCAHEMSRYPAMA